MKQGQPVICRGLVTEAMGDRIIQVSGEGPILGSASESELLRTLVRCEKDSVVADPRASYQTVSSLTRGAGRPAVRLANAR